MTTDTHVTLKMLMTIVAARNSLGVERTGEQVHQISGPNLLKKRNRNPLLRSKQHVPQNQCTQKERHEARDSAAGYFIR